MNLVRRGGDDGFQVLRDLVAVHGIEWLNKCRDQFGWGVVHYAAAGLLAGSNKSPKDGPRFLDWLYKNHATMNLLTGREHERVPVGSTCLHVAVARGQLECVKFLLQSADESFVGYPNSLGLSARDMTVPFADAFNAWEERQKNAQPAENGHSSTQLSQTLLASGHCRLCDLRTANPPAHTNDVVDRLFSLHTAAANPPPASNETRSFHLAMLCSACAVHFSTLRV